MVYICIEWVSQQNQAYTVTVFDIFSSQLLLSSSILFLFLFFSLSVFSTSFILPSPLLLGSQDTGLLAIIYCYCNGGIYLTLNSSYFYHEIYFIQQLHVMSVILYLCFAQDHINLPYIHSEHLSQLPRDSVDSSRVKPRIWVHLFYSLTNQSCHIMW